MVYWPYDLPHIGVMCGKIRERRGVKPAYIASKIGISRSTISRFENPEEEVRFKKFRPYVGVLQTLPPPDNLTPQQARLLCKLKTQSSNSKKIGNEGAALNFAEIKSSRRRAQFKDLLDRLKQEKNPAAIVDSFWFVHANNGALLRMFDMTPNSEYLYNWEAWHSLATKFREDSPVRQAYANIDGYLAPSINQFFMDEAIHPFFFSRQMRMLLHRIFLLSEKNHYKFAKFWSNSVTFNLDFESNSLSRAHWFEGHLIHSDASLRMQTRVELLPENEAIYSLIVWDPVGKETEEAFEIIKHGPYSREVFFADDYDRNKDFHINTWPEVQNWWNVES